METRSMIAKTLEMAGSEVILYGWVNSRRDHGKVTFFDLKDRSGIVQVVVVPPLSQGEDIKQIRDQWVLRIRGTVKDRPVNMINTDLETGRIEVEAQEVIVVNRAKPLPFDVTGDTSKVNEEVRLKYRYLDMRSPRVAQNLALRAKVFNGIRKFFHGRDFTEIDTPYISKSTPEGARDYLVPSRIEKGKFYALPQSPQQYKQLLMVGGIEKYFQIARCFRDEDMRGDRQPEFTQLDVEMSFTEDEEDILRVFEEMFGQLVAEVAPHKKMTFDAIPRLKYADVMAQYKTDKPDLRKDKNDPNELALAFIIDFPMFEWKESEKRWDAVHHPFTRPKVMTAEDLRKSPKDIVAYQYDVVLNGYEVAGGSLRTHDPELLAATFEVMGNKKEDIQAKSGHLLEAFSYGVPPHGGIASGLDRLIMILAGEPNIREVIPFPKASDGHDLMMSAPSDVDKSQLDELGLQLKGHKGAKT